MIIYENGIRVLNCDIEENDIAFNDEKFDLVFIDADKKNYKNYFNKVLPMVNPGGIILVDNVLWSGKVIDLEKHKDDRLTKVMDDFNRHIANNDQVTKMILPVRDGITIIIKNEK